MSLASYLMKEKAYGRTDKQILDMLGWMSVNEYYNEAISKFAFKVLNTKEPKFVFDHFTNNRNIRNESENKIFLLVVK